MENHIKTGNRLYHAIFGWCKIISSVSDKTLVDLEADEIEYYVMGHGYVKYSRDKSTNQNILYTPTKDLFESDSVVPKEYGLQKMALNPQLTFWKKK
jgi:hypothetical protein